MATIESLREKVQKSQEKVEKCKAIITRHEKQLEKKIAKVSDLNATLDNLAEKREEYRGTDRSWDLYEVESKLNDIKGAKKKLAEAEGVLQRWEDKLGIEVEKERFLTDNAPQVIKDFLENWKQLAYKWYVKRYESYQQYKVELDEQVKQAYKTIGIEEYRRPNKEQEKALKEMELDYRSIQSKKSQFSGAIVGYMDTIRNETERLTWLEKTLEQDKKAKMLDLINRVNKVVGSIKDASNLEISPEGNLNGYVIGEKGKAKVETIGAGGWNIQVFHYRTLVHKIG